MKSSKETRRAARKLFRSCLVDSRMDEGRVRMTVQLVVAQKPRRYLGILTQLEKLVYAEEQKSALTVESAVALEEPQRQQLQTQVQKNFRSPLKTTYRANPALIGGLRLQIGSNVWNGSISARLDQLRIKN